MDTIVHLSKCLKPLLWLFLNSLLGRWNSAVKIVRTFKKHQTLEQLFTEHLLCIRNCARSWVYNGKLYKYVILAKSLILILVFSTLN